MNYTAVNVCNKVRWYR